MDTFRIEVAGTTYPVHIISSPLDARQGQILENVCYGVDIETAPMFLYKEHDRGGLDRYLSFIRLIQIFDGEAVYIFDDVVPDILKRHNWASNYFVAHNAMFELQHLSSLDGLSQPEIHCSQIMDRLVLGAEKDIQYTDKASLEACCKRWLNIEVDKEMQLSDWSGELSREQLVYAAKDAVYPKLLARHLHGKILEHNMYDVYKVNRQAQKPLVEMMINGMAFDADLHERLVHQWEQESKAAEEDVRRHLKSDSINLNSGKQLTEWVRANIKNEIVKCWPETASPKNDYLQFNADSLAHLRHVPFVNKLLAYKKYAKRLSTYGRSFREHINPITERVHCSYTLAHTKTGRTSAYNPNLQNQPRPEEGSLSMKDCFIAPDATTLVGADYSQIEMRVSAELSGDSTMLSAFEDGADLHIKIAALIAGVGEDSVTKEQRQSGKIFNYSLLFGAGAKTTAHRAKKEYGVDMTVEEAEAGVEAFRKLYPTYREWQVETANGAQNTLQTRTPLGRLRRLPSNGYYTRSMNTPVQGGAGEVILIALIELQNSLNGLAKITNCVHDEIILEAPAEHVPKCKRILEESMIQAWNRVFPGACSKDLVDASDGKSWRECK